MENFKVKTDVPEEEMSADQEGILVPARWLLHRKPTRIVKARLVAQQVNDGSLQDTFAATPSTVGQRLLLMKSAERDWPVALGDVSTAFLHAPLEPADHIYLQPPPNLRVAKVVCSRWAMSTSTSSSSHSGGIEGHMVGWTLLYLLPPTSYIIKARSL